MFRKKEEPGKLNWGLIVKVHVHQAKKVNLFSRHQGEEMGMNLCGVKIP